MDQLVQSVLQAYARANARSAAAMPDAAMPESNQRTVTPRAALLAQSASQHSQPQPQLAVAPPVVPKLAAGTHATPKMAAVAGIFEAAAPLVAHMDCRGGVRPVPQAPMLAPGARPEPETVAKAPGAAAQARPELELAAVALGAAEVPQEPEAVAEIQKPSESSVTLKKAGLVVPRLKLNIGAGAGGSGSTWPARKRVKTDHEPLKPVDGTDTAGPITAAQASSDVWSDNADAGSGPEMDVGEGLSNADAAEALALAEQALA